MNYAEPLVLGIETSCDETGVGIVRGTTLLANAIASSMEEHARYGGVVPEVAARAHLEEQLGDAASAGFGDEGVHESSSEAHAARSRRDRDGLHVALTAALRREQACVAEQRRIERRAVIGGLSG